MPDILPNLTEMDDHIAAVRDNLRELVEQVAAYSGAGDENLMSQRIDEQEALLERLTKRRDELSGPKLPAHRGEMP
jgi:ppGpp synthetase/RelA/SpoT-type nucleotidyltranferase